MILRALGRQPYLDTLAAMRAFTDARTPDTPDELWRVEHPPVFTLGLAARPEHLLAPGDIAVVATERGGQVTYHGPGQAVVYLLLDLHRLGLGVRGLVDRIETATIALLADHGVPAVRRGGAPGVYVDAAHPVHGGAKIAALGLKVRRGCTFHGAALNVAMDLEPFSRINPCGYAGLRVVDLRSLVGEVDPEAVGRAYAERLAEQLGQSDGEAIDNQ